MEELIIQTHNFEDAKGQLKKFSEQTTIDLDLEKVNTSKGIGEFLFGGGFGFDHKVTGSELNSLTTQIQNKLIGINEVQRDIIVEFGQVYNALEALDKEYIQGILTAIKSAQKANEDVRGAQGDIERTIEVQKKTIRALQQFKVKIDGYDIEKMWYNIQYLMNVLDSLNEMKDMIDSIEHLEDIDSLWDGFKESGRELDSLADAVKNIIETIHSLKQQSEILDKKMNFIQEAVTKQEETNKTFSESMNSINKHVEYIDMIYDYYELLKKDISTMKDTVSKQDRVISNLEDSLLEQQNKSEELEKMISKKMKLAYLVGGSTVGLVVIEFILLMMR